MLWLDTWTALSPSADPLGTKEQARLAATIVELCEDIGGLVIVVDHSRKNRPDGQPLSSADIFGPPQKWAVAEHIVMLEVVEAGQRLEVFVEGKDLETRRFFLTVTPQGSGQEKFTYAGSVDELIETRREVGQKNRQRILTIIQAHPAGIRSSEIVAWLEKDSVSLSPDTVIRHGTALVAKKLVVKSGKGPETRWKPAPAPLETPPPRPTSYPCNDRLRQ
jgi:hypothetical protein